MSVLDSGRPDPRPSTTSSNARISLDAKFAGQLCDNLDNGDVKALVSHHCDTAGIDKEEKRLWSLVHAIVGDCEMAARYEPGAINIDAVPPQRRWFISHFAHFQNVLMRHANFRRMNLVLRWLEQMAAAETRPVAPLETHPSELVHQIVFSALRSGDIRAAQQHAEHGKLHGIACSIAAARLTTVPEPWMARSAVVPLFGEYANSETSSAAWATNDHRLSAIAALYEESARECPTQRSELALERAICGALSGNLEAMTRAFGPSRRWQDELWCRLRAILITVFAKALLTSGHTVSSPTYLSAVTTTIDSQAPDWLKAAEQSFTRNIVSLCHDALSAADGLTEAERIQLHFIVAVLENRPLATFAPLPPRPADVRLPFHLLAAIDLAVTSRFLSCDVQGLPAFGEVTARHLASLVTVSPSDAQQRETCLLAVRVAMVLRDPLKRASAYEAVIRRARLDGADRRRTPAEIQEFDAALLDAIAACEVKRFGNKDLVEMVLANLARAPAADTVTLLANEAAEGVFWRSLSDRVVAVYKDALNHCSAFWTSGELDAIADVVDVLVQRVVPRLPRHEVRIDLEPFAFWRAFSEIRRHFQAHQRAVLDLRNSPSATLADQLRSTLEETRDMMAAGCVALASSASLATDVFAAAAAFAVQLFSECVAVEIGLSDVPSALFAKVLHLLVRLEESGIFESLLPQKAAADLFFAIRSARAALNDREHELAFFPPEQ